MSEIFINYRHSDAADSAGRLYDGLCARFGSRKVFLDTSGILVGQDIDQSIRARLKDCRVLLALIGRGWLHASDDQGRRRLDAPEDVVRLEIAVALSANFNVIPVLLHDASMPSRESLPEDLQALAALKSARLRHESWDVDVAELSKRLGRLVKANYRDRVRRVWRRVIMPSILVAGLALLARGILWTRVPSVEGLSVEAAVGVLEAKAIDFRINYADHSVRGLGSRIAAQDPAAGTQANRLIGVQLNAVPGIQISESPPEPTHLRDAQLRQSVLGTWRQIRHFSGAFVDQLTTFSSDGRVRTEGDASFFGQSTPYVIQGNWRVEDSQLQYHVRTSTVPTVIAPGFVGGGDLLAISADQMAIREHVDGKTYVDARLP